MKILGTIVILMWVSIAHILYPFPNQLTKDFDRFVKTETNIYLQTLSESQRADYFSNKEKFLESSITRNTVITWTKWIIKAMLIIVGILAGLAMYFHRTFWHITLATSISFLIMWASQTGITLSALGQFSIDSFREFLLTGTRTTSPPFVLLFYEYFLFLPVLHLYLVGFCIYSKVRRL